MTVTTGDLYEQVKRSLLELCKQHKMVNVAQGPFIMACHECGLPFRSDVEMGMISEHAELEHDLDPERGSLQLDLIWIGEGPPPEGKA